MYFFCFEAWSHYVALYINNSPTVDCWDTLNAKRPKSTSQQRRQRERPVSSTPAVCGTEVCHLKGDKINLIAYCT